MGREKCDVKKFMSSDVVRTKIVNWQMYYDEKFDYFSSQVYGNQLDLKFVNGAWEMFKELS